jgi:hypothetical protein
MRFTQRIMIAAAMAVVVSAGPAMAHGYNGNTINTFVPASRGYSGAWPVTIKGSQFSNGTGCLTLTENASGGSASLAGCGKKRELRVDFLWLFGYHEDWSPRYFV